MMKYDDSKKITALGVVIFSFLSILIMVLVTAVFGSISSLLVLKTELSEGLLKVGNVVGAGLGAVTATAFLTAVGKVRGITATAIVTVMIIALKWLGNMAMDLGGYFTLNGLISILFVLIFSFIGGVVGGAIKK